MSNPKILVDKIKGLMKEFGFAAEVELMSFSIEDENNTIVQVEKLAVGNKVLKINEEFNQVSLEDGTFKLKENFEIQVANGEIVAVKEIFLDAKLSDGTVIKIEGDAVTEGAKVIVVTEQGEIPAPDGVHELEDGSKIEVKDGIISYVEVAGDVEVGEAPEAVGVEVEAGMKDNPAKMAAEADEIIAILKEFVAALEAKYSAVQGEVEAMKAELNAFKKQPAAAPIKNGKTDFNKVSKTEDVLDARVAAILGARK
jgi:hypothetical protein